jgi:allantoin racemase
MRIWYQSMTRPGALAGYNRSLRQALDAVKARDTVIDVAGIEREGGTYDQYRYLAFRETIELLENVGRAEREGYDAFVIGNVCDPGIREAREIASIPVIGLGEASMLTASHMGESFSIVAINEKLMSRIIDNVRRVGLQHRMAAIQPIIAERLTDFDKAFGDASLRQAIVDQFLRVAEGQVAQGAEVVIVGGGVLAALLVEAGIHEVKRAPVLHGIAALVKQAESAVHIRQAMGGHFTSKRLAYRPPDAGQMMEIRRIYGESAYPAKP